MRLLIGQKNNRGALESRVFNMIIAKKSLSIFCFRGSLTDFLQKQLSRYLFQEQHSNGKCHFRMNRNMKRGCHSFELKQCQFVSFLQKKKEKESLSRL